MFTRIHRRLAQVVERPTMAVLLALVVSMSNVGVESSQAAINTSQVGQGFVINAPDLRFILKQIKIAERHSRAFEGDSTAAPQPNPNPALDPSYCLSMIGTALDQVPDPITSYGLRTVGGECNNLARVLEQASPPINSSPKPAFFNHPTFGGADQPFPRLADPNFRNAEQVTFDPDGPGPVNVGDPTTYAQKLNGNVVFDTQPRLISNLIVDQTSTNPAAIAAAASPVRAQNGGNPSFPCEIAVGTHPANSPDCIPQYDTLFIENVTTDVGLSPPYNSLFTFFGQFFDHGVDQTVKSSGSVIVPLRDDDPLVAGPDHILGIDCANTPTNPGCADNLAPQLRFIPLTRAQNQPGPDGVIGTADDVQDANNTDTPWVDQSQTYTSHGAHQFFLREYVSDGAGHPLPTGKFLGGLDAGLTYSGSPDGRTGISTWASTKLQAATKLGLLLQDQDVTNIPMIFTDPYGNYIPGPARGLPMYVTTSGFVEGNLASPVPVPTDVLHFDTPFLTDIAHNAEPKAGLVPDADSTPSADFAHQPTGTYDNEMLDAHFTCGDGRCNENIALSTVHQIFHSEHNRLVKEFDTVTLPVAENAALSADYHNTNCPIGCPSFNSALPTTFTYGERLFQAARFVTEMEYQHLVFEEFARKIQPAVRPFHVYSPDINPATKAEFAHAVYRFGHSMLHDQVARVDACLGGLPAPVCTGKPDNTKVDNSVPLLTAFLNPPEFFNNGHGGFYTPEQAAAAIVMGSSDQTGNELDEFINETLRNNLLGLPLDLATFNLTRARSEGIPPLNDVRRQIFAATNDGQLTPYTSWTDFEQHLKHPESLINFVAAYGTHPTIRDSGPDGILGNGDDVTTAAAKRAAARAIVAPIVGDVQPSDATDFMFSTGTWASVNGVTITGLDSVDLWVGGLAEVTNLFGGLLGTTFNYVFQTQLEILQDGDRFYYLARTPGMNLRTQLEGNSFAELILRNTMVTDTASGTNTLKADSFASADCKFQLANLTSPANAAGNDGILNTADDNTIIGQGSVNDDPTTDCNENKLLLKQPDGTIKYRQVNGVDPVGINGQMVMNGTEFADIFYGGNDNDTFWGGGGNDRIEGGGGDDVEYGGDGDDIITDLDGADLLKGGPGNDAMDAGPGNDILLSNEGNDLTNGGANDNETFAGIGNDFVIAGQGADAVFGDDGDDWIEGGTGQDLLQGDHGAPFFDDPGQTKPGNEIFIGQPGENDYDAEGGDDLMSMNAAIERNAGAGGFDWAFHQYNTLPADDDMEINKQLIGVVLPVVVNRDRWQETEADSGDKFDDLIKGSTDILPIGGAGFTGCDALDPAGVARIVGLNKLVTTFPTPLSSIVAVSATGFCPLTGFGAVANNPTSGFVWAEGNIILGGGGSDSIEGRGNNDIIDGDHRLRVAISVRVNPADPTTEIGRTDLIEGKATSGNFGPGTTGMTLQQVIFAGNVHIDPANPNTVLNPGNLVAVREIVLQDGTPMGLSANTNALADCSATTPLNCDKALFAGARAEYDITGNADGSVTVNHARPAVAGVNDGIDTLWNMEELLFCDVPDPVVKGRCTTRSAPIFTAPAAVASPLAFGNRVVNTSISQSITVTNSGIGNLDVGAVTLTGDSAFTLSPGGNGCTGKHLVLGGSCQISVTFAPTAPGLMTASVAIAHNAAGSPTVVSVSGTGTEPIAGATPSAINFGNVNVGATSGTRVVTLSNSGAATLNISSIAVTGTGFFRVAGGCGATLAAGANCSINIRFAPTAIGTSLGLLRIIDNSHNIPGSIQAVDLVGTGVSPIITASISPNALDFVTQVGSVIQLPVTVTNTGLSTTAMTISTAVVGSGFARVGGLPGNCGPTLAAGLSCTITVRFSPTIANGGGNRTGTLTVNGNFVGAPQTVTLSGNGTITANNDPLNPSLPITATASGLTTPQTINFAVRANDAPVNTGTVTIDSFSFTNGGATAVGGGALEPTVVNNLVSWALQPIGALGNARAASKRGTYIVNYRLTSGTATSTATYTLTVR